MIGTKETCINYRLLQRLKTTIKVYTLSLKRTWKTLRKYCLIMIKQRKTETLFLLVKEPMEQTKECNS